MIESSYTKLFSSIVTSTIWREDDKTRIVWITMLAIKNRHGQVAGSVPGLAALSNVSLQDCRNALVKLAGPDPDSRSKEYEGRRIEAVDGGWQILNHAKYRDAMSEDHRRAYQAEWQRKYRQRQKDKSVDSSVDMKLSTLTHADTDTDIAEREYAPNGFSGHPSKEEVLSFSVGLGLAEWKALDWFSEMEGCGWLDHHSRPIAVWSEVLSRVHTKWVADGKPVGPPSAQPLPQTQTHPTRQRGLSPLDLRTIIQAKETEAASLKNRHASEVAMGLSWTDENARLNYIQLKQAVKKLNQRLAAMA